jgi:GPI mannosyltransferase 3
MGPRVVWLRVRHALLALVAIGAVGRSVMAALDYSIYFPDEIFQSLEPAHRFAFGYGMQAWEFLDKARSWIYPGIIGGWMWLLAQLGVESAQALVLGVKLLLVAGSLPGLWASMRFAERRAGADAAIVAGLLGLTYPLLSLMVYRPLSEPISASIWMVVVYGLFARVPGERGRGFALGLLAGLAVFVRFQSGLLLVLCGLGLLGRREWRMFFLFAAGAAVAGLLGGLVDWVSWGTPYISFWRYLEFNLIEQGAAVWGIHPSDHYWRYLLRTTGALPSLLLLVGMVAGATRAPSLAAFSLVFYLAHVQVPHKELRFLIPVVPMALTLAAIGWSRIGAWIGRADPSLAQPLVVVLGGALAIGFVWRSAHLTYGDTGLGSGAPHRIFGAMASVNLAMSKVGRRPDACGIIVKTNDLVAQGGYTYLHRDIPLLYEDNGQTRKLANYVVARHDLAVGQTYVRIRRVGDVVIYRRPGACDRPDAWRPPIASFRPNLKEIEAAKRKFHRELEQQGKRATLW